MVLLLLVSIDSVEGAKKKKQASTTQDADVAAAPKDTGAYRGSGATSTTTPTTPPPTDAAAQKAEQRKAELARKRADKEASRRAAALKQAKLRANQLALRRAQKTSRDSKARATLRQRAEDLAQKKRKADTPEMRRKGHEKLQTLLKRTAESSTRMISFDTTQYHRYVSEGPRPYFLMLVYTALSAQHNCHYCHVANQALIPVAQAHYERNQQQIALVLSSNTTADLADSQLPVFFVNVDMGRNPELFKELKFNQAPYMVLAPPRLGTKTLKPLDFIRTLPQKYRFNLQASMSAGDFQGFVNKLAGCHVQLDAAKPGFLDLLFSLVVLFALAFVGFKYGYDILMKLRELRGVRFLALAAGLGLYCWCIAGGMYNVITTKGKQYEWV